MKSNLIYFNKRENILVYLFVFAAWWQFMLGLHLFNGGLTLTWRMIHGEILLYLIIFFAVFYFKNKGFNIFQYSNFNSNIVTIFSICYIPILLKSLLFGALGALFPFFLIIIFLRLRDSLKIRIFDVFIKVLSFTLFLSVIEYLIYTLTGQCIVVFSSIPTDSGNKLFDQTLFNFIPLYDQISLGFFTFFRFQSLSDEPGNIGTISAFLLFATSNSKKYKYSYIIFWVAGILSFSVAFYILAAIHLVFSLKKRNIKFLFIAGLLVFIIYHYFHEAFDLFLLNRFSKDNIESLDNRSTAEFDAHLLAAFRDGSLWFGKGFEVGIDTGGHGGVAGFKAFLWIYGIIGTLLVLLGYIICYLKILKRQSKYIRRYGLIFLMVFLLSFYQREYINYFDYVVIFFTMPLLLTYKELNNSSTNLQTRR